MSKKVECAHCGKMVDLLCSSCWRCKDCKLDCPEHMKRTVNGHLAEEKKN